MPLVILTIFIAKLNAIFAMFHTIVRVHLHTRSNAFGDSDYIYC